MIYGSSIELVLGFVVSYKPTWEFLQTDDNRYIFYITQLHIKNH